MDRVPQRVLNRTTLHRQWLLDRRSSGTREAVEHLIALQAQNPLDPYWGLWSRVHAFDPLSLSHMIESRQAVRGQLLRGTIHLTTSDDFLDLRPQVQAVLARILGSTTFGRDTRDVDREPLLELGRALLEKEPLTRAELSKRLEERWPGVAGASLAQVVTYLLPVVQVPPRGLWGGRGAARWVPIESWVGSELRPGTEVRVTIRRYLAAFGPASVADMRAWSGIAGLREVVDGMGSELRTYRTESGAELYDLPDLPLIDAETPAPPRFLPEYDNVLLGHADRSRFFADDTAPLGWTGNLMVDGTFAGAWKPVPPEGGRPARLEVTMLVETSRAAMRRVVEEGQALLGFAYPTSSSAEVVFVEI